MPRWLTITFYVSTALFAVGALSIYFAVKPYWTMATSFLETNEKKIYGRARPELPLHQRIQAVSFQVVDNPSEIALIGQTLGFPETVPDGFKYEIAFTLAPMDVISVAVSNIIQNQAILVAAEGGAEYQRVTKAKSLDRFMTEGKDNSGNTERRGKLVKAEDIVSKGQLTIIGKTAPYIIAKSIEEDEKEATKETTYIFRCAVADPQRERNLYIEGTQEGSKPYDLETTKKLISQLK